MTLEPHQKELFNKLKIKTLLDLALTLPKSYEDNRLSEKIEIDRVSLFEVVVERSFFRGRSFIVSFFIPKFKKSINGIFFRSSSYHYRTFSEGSYHIVKGKVTLFNGSFYITQPKSIKYFGEVITKYKSGVRDTQIKVLVKELITEENLLNEGLTPVEAKTILTLHFPERYNWENPTVKYSEKLLEILKKVEAFNHLKKLRAKRVDYKAISSLKGSVKEFINELPFKLTKEQEKAILQIKKDLKRENIATKRVIIGDVGSGKTVIILASAMIAREFGSILMVPTSILANQIYEEANKYLSKFMKIALLTQNRVEGEIEEAKFIIGTHAILYKKNISKFPLIMVDEQHRFGSNQRAELEKLVRGEDKNRKAHFLQFSATPIPRTQAMIESEIVDVTLIDTLPFERVVHTEIIGKSEFKNLIKHIEGEIKKNHQVVIIYPLVKSSDKIPYLSIDEAKEFWLKNYDGVYVTHGKDKEKDEVLENFRDNGKILLSTTVVEVGISLPRLTIIVIVGAERLGLASLHQLRGRVGRNGIESWCYLYTNSLEIPERLVEFCSTKNGFDIAKLDLKYRDSGDILDGTVQSGQRFRWLNLSTDEDIIQDVKKRLQCQINS